MLKFTMVNGIRTLSLVDEDGDSDSSTSTVEDTQKAKSNPPSPMGLNPSPNMVQVCIEEPDAELRAVIKRELAAEEAAKHSRPWEEVGEPVVLFSEPDPEPPDEVAYLNQVTADRPTEQHGRANGTGLRAATGRGPPGTLRCTTGSRTWNSIPGIQVGSEDDVEWRNVRERGPTTRLDRVVGDTPPCPGWLPDIVTGSTNDELGWDSDGLSQAGTSGNTSIWDTAPLRSARSARIRDALEAKPDDKGATQVVQPAAEFVEGGWPKVEISFDNVEAWADDDAELEDKSKDSLPYPDVHYSDTDDDEESEDEYGGFGTGAHRQVY